MRQTNRLLHRMSQQQLRSKIGSLKALKPAIITDIDGVLIRGKEPIPKVIDALRKIKQNQIPFACLTNGAGQLECNRAEQLNAIFNAQDFFNKDNVVMSHTPLKPHLKQQSAKGLLLITGTLNIQEVVQDLGISNYITADELFVLMRIPFMDEQLHKSLTERLKIQRLFVTYKHWAEEISAIFAINDVSPYETSLQVIHNIYRERTLAQKELQPYFASQNDTVWAGGYPRPRIAFGPFNYMLEAHCLHHNFPFARTYFGKPQAVAFQYVQSVMQRRFETNLHFMIGDNPRADIRGANFAQWPSFLTQTGVHQGPDNDPDNPATFVVYDFAQAVDIIISICKGYSTRE